MVHCVDAVPPVHVVSNHFDTDKLTTANGGSFRRVQPVAVANHGKARQVTDRTCCNVIGY